MANTLEDKVWEVLLSRIQQGRCTPFLGAGACFGFLPLGKEIAKKLAEKFDYPLGDREDLVKVSQYVALQYDALYPKDFIIKQFGEAAPPDFKSSDEPHGLLADLPLPVYMTTNYDDFMVKALKHRYRDPKRELCRWNALIKHQPSIFDSQPDFKPTPANPIVFHLHGHNELPESIVLTEDDYLEFLANIARDQNLLPSRIQTALAGSSLLFIGYNLTDWDFRVLFQGLRPSLKFMSVAVLVPPGDSEQSRLKAQQYLDKYYKAMDLQVYWGSAREFSAELRKRWEVFPR
jgi:hypothetical protein